MQQFSYHLSATVLLCVKCVLQCVCVFAAMVSQLQQVVAQYVQRVQEISFVPGFSYGRGFLRDDGGPNRFTLGRPILLLVTGLGELMIYPKLFTHNFNYVILYAFFNIQ